MYVDKLKQMETNDVNKKKIGRKKYEWTKQMRRINDKVNIKRN